MGNSKTVNIQYEGGARVITVPVYFNSRKMDNSCKNWDGRIYLYAEDINEYDITNDELTDTDIDYGGLLYQDIIDFAQLTEFDDESYFGHDENL